MSDIQIDSGIPIPPRATGEGRTPKYPFRQMEVGDSFLVPYMDGRPRGHTARRMAAATKSAVKRTGWKFTARQLSDGLRVWRVA